MMHYAEFVLLIVGAVAFFGGIGIGLGYAAWRDVRKYRPDILAEIRSHENG